MSTWAEVDLWEVRARAAPPTGRWRCFARLADKRLRFLGRDGDKRIKAQRPCYHVPGRWRAAGWLGTHKLTPAQFGAVQVARDAWLDRGCPVMTRPTVIP